MGVIKNVQIKLVKITDKFRRNPPLFCPNKTPITIKVNNETDAATLTKEVNASGLSLKSPTDSLFTENKYPINVIANAH